MAASVLEAFLREQLVDSVRRWLLTPEARNVGRALRSIRRISHPLLTPQNAQNLALSILRGKIRGCDILLIDRSAHQDDFLILCAGDGTLLVGLFDGHGPSGHDVSSFTRDTLGTCTYYDTPMYLATILSFWHILGVLGN